MEKEKILNELIRIVDERFLGNEYPIDWSNDDFTQPSDIEADHTFKDDLGLDSLDIVELVMDVESHYKIQISDDIFDDLIHKDIQYLVDYLYEKQKR